jgi:cytochrome c-type biogenesis protein CcmE
VTYRDELGQAHERIEQLQRALEEERAKQTVPALPERPRRRLWVIVVGAFVLAGVAAFVGFRSKPAPLLVKPADELVRDGARYTGSRMRVQGELVPGTTKRREQDGQCELTMVIERSGLRLPVHMRHCTLPDNFRDASGILITAEGSLSGGGVFEASQVLVAWADMFPGMR